MKLFLISIVAVAILPLFSFAQSNFKPGYVIDLKGDTIKGFIDYQEWEKNPRQVTFKNTGGTTQRYTAQTSNGFAAAGLEYFEAHTVNISQDEVDLDKLGGILDTTSRVDTVFMKVLIKGRYLSLFSYTDAIKTRYFIMEHGGVQPQELVYHVYMAQDNNVKYVSRYRTQLAYEAQKNNVNNARLSGLISQAKYDMKDLVQVVAMINGSDSYEVVTKSQFGTRWFAGAGVSYNDMVFTGDIKYGDAYSLFPQVAFGIDILPNKNTQQFFLRAELSATGNSHDFKDQSSELKVVQNTGSLVLQAYYSFYNGQKAKIFAGGGLSVNFSTYPTHYYIANGGVDDTPIKNTGYPDYHTIWESVLLKAGVIVNKQIEIYAGYSPPTTVTNNYSNFGGNVMTYQAGVNFLFGAK